MREVKASEKLASVVMEAATGCGANFFFLRFSRLFHSTFLPSLKLEGETCVD